jgi:hypothetical protein
MPSLRGATEWQVVATPWAGKGGGAYIMRAASLLTSYLRLLPVTFCLPGSKLLTPNS